MRAAASHGAASRAAHGHREAGCLPPAYRGRFEALFRIARRNTIRALCAAAYGLLSRAVPREPNSDQTLRLPGFDIALHDCGAESSRRSKPDPAGSRELTPPAWADRPWSRGTSPARHRRPRTDAFPTAVRKPERQKTKYR